MKPTSATAAELKGEVWVGYWTELGTIYTIKMVKQKNEFIVDYWKADNSKASSARFFLEGIKPNGQVIFKQDISQTNNSNHKWIATIDGDGKRIINGYRTINGVKGDNKWELIRTEVRPKNK